MSVNGNICYGVLLDVDSDIPWEDEKYEFDIEVWWRKIKGFEQSREIYTDDGERRLDGITEDDVKKHYAEEHEWLKDNPLPVELVNYCSGDEPMYILAYPDSVLTCYLGHPLKVSSAVIDTDNAESLLIDFCKDHLIRYVGAPELWLSSYYG